MVVEVVVILITVGTTVTAVTIANGIERHRQRRARAGRRGERRNKIRKVFNVKAKDYSEPPPEQKNVIVLNSVEAADEYFASLRAANDDDDDGAAAAAPAAAQDSQGAITSNEPFSRFDVAPSVPQYDHDTFEKSLASAGWTEQETDYLLTTYAECNGKWPVIADRYDYPDSDRTMEDLKARFYTVQATVLQLSTPITSMTASEYNQYETLTNFNPAQETSRKKLAEGHLYRRANEVDEETVLLGELQRIMLNQATLDSQREELRRRLDNPTATSGYSYATSQALTGLWQQLLTQDRMKKNPRLRPTGNSAVDGLPTMPQTSTTSRDPPRRPQSLASVAPSHALPVDIPRADQTRFGVVLQEKLPTGVTFTSDKLSKPRIAKSSIQTEKIAAILHHIGVPEVIPLPTPAVIAQFESIMQTVSTLLDLRKIGEKEDHEMKVRAAER